MIAPGKFLVAAAMAAISLAPTGLGSDNDCGFGILSARVTSDNRVVISVIDPDDRLRGAAHVALGGVDLDVVSATAVAPATRSGSTTGTIIARLPVGVSAASYALDVSWGHDSDTNTEIAIGLGGIAGPTGPMGPTGDAGPVGATGATGATGPTGPMGVVGDAGARGAMGPMGLAGAAGLVGPKGPIGDKGVTGPAGEAGAQGSAGDKGVTGLMGAMGAAGPIGAPGPDEDLSDLYASLDSLKAQFAAIVAGIKPRAPTNVTATVSNGSATVYFSTGAANGGAAPTSYTVTAMPGGITATGTGSPITINGLTNGVSYSFTVTANNAAGSSPSSAPSASVTPVAPTSVPSAPRSLVISQSGSLTGNAVSIGFSPSLDDGGAPVMRYIVRSTPSGVTASGTSSPIALTGLVPGQTYVFSVTAENSAGEGPALTSAPYTYITPPAPPSVTSVVAQDGTLTVSFAAQTQSNGAAIQSYVLEVDGRGSVQGTTSPLRFSNLPGGAVYGYSLRAVSAAGFGERTSGSVVMPGKLPTAPLVPRIEQLGDGTARIFVNPTSFPLSGIELQISSADTTFTISRPSDFGFDFEIPGLVNGTAYTASARVLNAIGASPWSAPSLPFEPQSFDPAHVALLAPSSACDFGAIDVELFVCAPGSWWTDAVSRANYAWPLDVARVDAGDPSGLFLTYDAASGQYYTQNGYIMYDFGDGYAYEFDAIGNVYSMVPIDHAFLITTEHRIVSLADTATQLDPQTLQPVSTDEPYTVVATPQRVVRWSGYR